MSKYKSTLTTPDELFIKSRKLYQELFNKQSAYDRTLGALGDCICSIRESSIYLNQYGDDISPRLERAMKKRIKAQKDLAIEYYRQLLEESNQ